MDWLLCWTIALVLSSDPPDGVIARIRAEAGRREGEAAGRPLPLASHWNTGGGQGQGFTPSTWQTRIIHGRHVLPWLRMPSPDPKGGLRADEVDAVRFLARRRMPFTLIGSQWDSLLSNDSTFFQLPDDDNPNVVDAKGQRQKKVHPFGSAAPWRAAGMIWGRTEGLQSIETVCPTPSRVVFLSNNEHAKLRWTDLEQTPRYVREFGGGRDDEFKRKLMGDGWIERYRAMIGGFRESLPPEWSRRAVFVGYNAFGPPHFARWDGWLAHSIYAKNRISPWPLAWDGGSVPYYLNHWEAISDDQVYSPQIQAMNWVFMLDEARRNNPQFWFELSVWDGYTPGKNNDKRAFFAQRGGWSPQRYAGMVQYGMWLLRPRVVREFRSHTDRLSEVAPYFDAVMDSVDRIFRSQLLEDFWRKGSLVVNTRHKHPYDHAVPVEYQAAQRWFALDCDLDPPRPWKLETRIPVLALALVKGESPKREWLIYAHAPAGAKKGVKFTIEGNRSVVMDVAIDGSFAVLGEESGRTTQIP